MDSLASEVDLERLCDRLLSDLDRFRGSDELEDNVSLVIAELA